MPLVFSLKEGQDFYVAEDQFVVEKIVAETRFMLREAKTQKVHEISDEHSVEIISGVFVSAGNNPPSSQVRIAIDAPRQILVLRGDRKRGGKPK